MSERKQTPKLLIFGIDGGTFDMIKPMLKEGKLPHLGRLMDEGIHGVLESTIPPLTAPAWATFFTGKNPGKHGIYDFVWQSTDKSDRPLVNAASIRGKTVW
jgi:predicted AlkP superfamily phosphohydrolase/phosphomutase